MNSKFEIGFSSGKKISKAVFPVTFGKQWERQPTFTKLWFYGLALRMRGDCYAVHCRFSRRDLKSLLANKDPRTWLTNQFNMHLRGVERVLVFEATNMDWSDNPKETPSTDLHLHGVICVGNTGITEYELNKRLQTLFTSRENSTKREIRYFKRFKAINIEQCSVERRNKASKYTVVGHAMGLLGYASKGTAKTKRALGILDNDVPKWFYKSRLANYFPNEKSRNQAFFGSIVSISRGLGAPAKSVFKQMQNDGYVRDADEFNSIELKKIIKEIKGLSSEDKIRIDLLGL